MGPYTWLGVEGEWVQTQAGMPCQGVWAESWGLMELWKCWDLTSGERALRWWVVTAECG